ncbi:DUF87 domain-containing protein [Altericroceibacterium spongiae]|uniref:DUF87 domain-containing protein n=1 Tax=Altericroceibacterium spongiae TaxID=2320269 RepID=A0A420EK39_9SPHN|nr:ATP-binding protein [Altericroceibacterium spongiae]RKF21091.1 DUF87 domain-containing protein [Altericroceibacterium spongiae]
MTDFERPGPGEAADHRPFEASGSTFVQAEPAAADPGPPIGAVLEVSGSDSRIFLDMERLRECAVDSDGSVAQAGQVGSQVKIRSSTGWVLANLRDQAQGTHNGRHGILAHIDFMGEGDAGQIPGQLERFRRGVTHFPMAGSPVYPAGNADLRQVYASDGRSAIQIGTVYPTADIRAGIYVDAMLGKHFALLGSTGTGKSTAAALILHRICDASPEGHIVMIDPHGEYAAAFSDSGEIFDVGNLQMPYWLMNFEEHCEAFLTSTGDSRQEDADILAKCLLKARSKNRLAESLGKITVDSPIPYLLSDLTKSLQDEMGQLDKATSSIPYIRIKSKIEDLKGDPRYSFMFSGMLVGDTMTQFLGKIFRMPGEGKPISIIDVSGVPSDITATVVALLSRLMFDFAIWGRTEATSPLLLVCEEAHRYVPNEKNADGSSVGRVLSRIAKEGRKYGVSLGLITQRPSDLAEGVLSQCGTILSMRLNNERDQAFVRAAMPEGARGFLDSIAALRNRECIICGEGVTVPVRVSFDELEESRRPASDDPSFSKAWRDMAIDPAMLDRIVQRWRSQSK